jgi:L-2,4-diaminobutyric acid acetyltransferase
MIQSAVPNTISNLIHFRSVTQTDGGELWRLVRSTRTLELNSAYFYLVFATDFADHCLVAEYQGKVVGAVIGYCPPRAPDTAFVWQIGVDPRVQGQGVGLRMLKAWLNLPAHCKVCYITATVAEDNPQSDRLFRALARDLQAKMNVSDCFTSDMFPESHPPEPLYRIGPIAR